MTIREALSNAGIDTLDASLLLAKCLSLSRTNILALGNEELSEEALSLFRKLVDKRKNGECVAYITGKKEFWGLEFFVSPAVLVPRPETELLVERVKEIVHGLTRIKILDLCTGSGAIAISLKHEMPELEIYATDISSEALEVAKKNAERLIPSGNDITFLQGDLFDLFSHKDTKAQRNFHLIVSNPPYVATDEISTLAPEVQNEPHIALDGGKKGLEIIGRIISEAPNYLERGGYLLLEADSRQMKDINILLADRGFKDIIIYKDLAGLDRVIGGIFE